MKKWGQNKTEEGKQSKDEKWSSRGATSSKSRHGTANINYPILLVKASFFLIKELRNWDLTLYWRLACKCNFVMAPLDHIVINLITTEQMLRMWSCTTTIYLYFVPQIFVKTNKYTQGLIIPNHVLVYLCVSQVSHISAGWMRRLALSTPLSGFHLCRAFCNLCCEQEQKMGTTFIPESGIQGYQLFCQLSRVDGIHGFPRSEQRRKSNMDELQHYGKKECLYCKWDCRTGKYRLPSWPAGGSFKSQFHDLISYLCCVKNH